MHGYDQAAAAELEQIMREIPGAKPGKMFGMPGYMVNGKLAVGIFQNFVVAKLGAERSAALIGSQGIERFEPTPGRAWKDWIKIAGQVQQHRDLLEEAVRYVAANR